MTNAASRYGIVNLDHVRQNNVVHIELGKPLLESIFERQYKMAARIIADIIHESDEAMSLQKSFCRECPRSSCDACIHRDSRGYSRGRSARQNLTQFHTAVPFIGERGTGKTSVMYSIWERLHNYNGNDPEAAFYLGHHCDQVQFVTLDMIDAGMLKTTDDVVEIILAQMLGYLEKLRKDNDFLDLYRRIDELHKDLCLFHEQEDRKREDFGLTNLQRVSDGRDAVRKFQQLVQEFLAAMSNHQFHGKKCYLVVALDDVDMYQGSNWGMKNTQFALLEHIYCHLRIPGLVVLMTFNEHLLKRACNRHFEEIYFGRRVERPYTLTEQMDIDELTAQFMSKLFPQEKRIYMPNYMLVDALDRPNLYVSPKLHGQPLAPFGADEEALPVKEFMLRLIAHKTGVYFDAAGTKKHFFEPRNLRELGELFQFVDSMEEIPRNNELQEELVRARNRQQLLDYLKNQYALRYLDAKEYEEFAGLLTLPLWRQDRTLIDKIRLQRQKVAPNKDDFGHLSGAHEDRWRYSYGELLHNIYFSTRISKNPGEDAPYLRKEFMRCIFGTQSVQMNEAVRSVQSRADILKVVGSSLAGRWANRMLPKLFVPNYDEPGGAGSISLPVRQFFNWQIPENVQSAILNLCAESKNSAKDVLADFMEALVVAGMFFTNVPSRGLEIQLDAGSGEDDEAALFLRSDSNEQICFNVLNFAINLYSALPETPDEDGYLTLMEKKLLKLGVRFSLRLQSDWENKYNEAMGTKKTLTGSEEENKRMYMSPDIFSSKDRQIRETENMLKHAQLWKKIKKMCEPGFDAKVFRNTWNAAVRKVIGKYTTSIIRWREEYGPYQWVLPVQNFDMMYNINKRLANVSYHDIPDDADASEVFTHYVKLYKSLAEELEKQDMIYFTDQRKGFCKAFRDCVFYSAITCSERTATGKLNSSYNSLIEEVLVSMVSASVRAHATRKRVSEIPI